MIKIFGITIITNKGLDKKFKAKYEMGLNIGSDVGYQTRKMDETHMGTIMGGYSVNKEADGILRRKA